MKNIIKFLLLALTFQMLTVACNEDEDDKRFHNIVEPTFNLYAPSTAINELYKASSTNPGLTLVWDDFKNSEATYEVVMSKTSDFSNPIVLGSTTNRTLTWSVESLNIALLQAGFTPYSSTLTYFRVQAFKSNSNSLSLSNTITITLSPYPVNKPVITSPSAGSSFILNSETPEVLATKVTWTDVVSGGSVTYKTEVSKDGTTWSSAGEVSNAMMLDWKMKDLNNAAYDAGLVSRVAGDLWVRVTSISTSKGGTITLVSEPVKISVTPYDRTLPKFFMVGAATVPDWNASNALPMYQDPINNAVISVYTYLNGNADFRFLGQQDWGPINYSADITGMRDNYKFFKTLSSNLTPAPDENMKFTGVSGYYKVAIDFAQKDLKIESVASVFRDDYPELYLAGSFQGWDASNGIAVPSVGNGVYETNINLPSDAAFKILGQKSWGDIEYGNIGKNNHGYHGFLGYKEDNGNIKFDGGGASCKIRIDIKRGAYSITKN